jgi:hypothetical protein
LRDVSPYFEADELRMGRIDLVARGAPSTVTPYMLAVRAELVIQRENVKTFIRRRFQ